MVVKQRNFARRRILLSTDICTRMREAKSRHDMDTAGVKIEIISLCIFTSVTANRYSFLKTFKTTNGHSFRSHGPFVIILTPFESQFKILFTDITIEGFI